MDKEVILSKYHTVCDSPRGIGFQIEHIPEFFDYDTTGNDIPHVHSFYEVIWFQEEGGTHTVDFQEYPIQANMLFFLSPGQVHHFDGHTRHKGVLLKFCTDFLKEEKGDEDIFIKYNVFNAFDSQPFCTIPDPTIANQLSRLVEQMETELNGNQDFGQLDIMRSMVKIFLVYVHRYGVKQDMAPLVTAKASHRLFVQFRRILEQKYDELHAVKEYSDLLNVSTKTLSNCIIECSGKAPLAFINDRIILEAKRLLRFTDMMVKEVAYRLGYEDASNFVKFFKRETGYLPSEFKEMDFNAQHITMKLIAVPTRDGQVDDHFGHCDHYTVFHINAEGQIIESSRLDSPQGCGCKSNIASTMQQMGITLMLAGNMGEGAFQKLSQHGIEVIRGCSGNIEEVVNQYLLGNLKDSCVACSSHECHGESEEIKPIKVNW